MIGQLKAFFKAEIADPAGDIEHQQQLAAASLMVEVMTIDHDVNDDERKLIHQLLEKQFKLSQSEIEQLLSLAQDQADQATSLYSFTRLINDHFSPERKNLLIKYLWQVAFADNRLDKHEEAMIRRVAELIYVSHTNFIHAKQLAQQEALSSN